MKPLQVKCVPGDLVHLPGVDCNGRVLQLACHSVQHLVYQIGYWMNGEWKEAWLREEEFVVC